MSVSQMMDSVLRPDDDIADFSAMIAERPRRIGRFLNMQPIGFLFCDAIAFILSCLATWAISSVLTNGVSLAAMRPDWSDVLVLGVLMTQLLRRGHYAQRIPFWTMACDVLAVSGLAIFCELLLSFKITGASFGLGEVLRWLLFPAVLLALRMATVSMLTSAGLWTLRTLIIGPSRDRGRVMAALQSEKALGFTVIGALNRKSFSDARLLTGSDRMVGRDVDYVVMIADPYDPEGDAQVVQALQSAGVPMSIVPVQPVLPARSGRAHYVMSHNVAMVSVSHAVGRSVGQICKRVFDITSALVLLVLASPLMLAIAFLVRRDGGSALYRHERVGAGGRSFPCMKFRSMNANSEAILAAHLQADPEAAAEWEASQKLRCDPRITKIGHVIRKTSLDELPQLFNVLRGEMSLVGPRPIVRSELRFYGEHSISYMQVKPGVTGLWQVSGRSDTSYERRVHLDVWYVRNWTFWHDMAILLKTVPVVLLRRGAV